MCREACPPPLRFRFPGSSLRRQNGRYLASVALFCFDTEPPSFRHTLVLQRQQPPDTTPFIFEGGGKWFTSPWSQKEL